MLNTVKKYHLALFYVIYIGFCLASNFVHPVTPAFLQLINCSNSMFGFAYSAMALGQFLTSALWGKVGDKIGYSKAIALGFFGYAFSALVFSMAKGPTLVIAGRFIAGCVVSSIQVNSMAYLTSIDAPMEERNSLLVLYASLQSICSAFGFLVGGLIGDFSVYYSFYAQIAALTVTGIITLVFIHEHSAFKKSEDKLTLKDVNPFTSIIQSTKILNVVVAVFLVSTLVTWFASAGFDQNFNYYLRAKFNFAPSSSGMFKAAVGLISLTVNMTVNMWIVKKTNVSKSLCAVVALAGVSILAMVFSQTQTQVMVFALMYYAFYAIYLPLQQAVMLKNDDKSSKGAVSGLFNAAKSFGMMAGPLFAGLVFDINPDYAFMTFGAGLIIGAIICYVNYKMLVKKGIE